MVPLRREIQRLGSLLRSMMSEENIIIFRFEPFEIIQSARKVVHSPKGLFLVLRILLF